MFINDIQDMAAAALASGTHRVEIHESENGLLYGRLVEREQPDPEILYMPKARDTGYAFVCETPVSDHLGKKIEIVGVPEPDSPFRFKLTVSFTDESGKFVQYPLEVKKEAI